MTTFTSGQTLGQGDLSIYLTTSGGDAANAYEITYAIYYVDPGPPEVEVLLGSATRTPINPTIGEYYASLQVPGAATPGRYRIRWTFRQYAGDAPAEVIQEWNVAAPGLVAVAPYSAPVAAFILNLRRQLRDHCLGGEELVEVEADGERFVLPLSELHSVLSG